MKIDEFDGTNNDDNDNDNNIIGYSYNIKLILDKSNIKYYYYSGNNDVKKINKNQVINLMRKNIKVKFLLVPIFKVYNKSMNVSFIIKNMAIRN